MKLGSLKEGGRDGTLVVVDRTLKRAVLEVDPDEVDVRSRQLGERDIRQRDHCAQLHAGDPITGAPIRRRTIRSLAR